MVHLDGVGDVAVEHQVVVILDDVAGAERLQLESVAGDPALRAGHIDEAEHAAGLGVELVAGVNADGGGVLGHILDVKTIEHVGSHVYIVSVLLTLCGNSLGGHGEPV